jgi:hypothetical protein
MRHFCVALALAGALIPFAPARASETAVRVAQMARDVTDAVRHQRNQHHGRTLAPCATTDGRKR